MTNTDKQKIQEILSRGVEDVFVRDHLEKALFSGKVLRIKFGIDPTGPKIHLGRAIPLRKLRALQDLGHQVILIIGDFTARIGDPSDKTEKRPVLTKKQVRDNMKNYKKSLAKIIDIKKAKIVYNSRWLSRLPFEKVIELADSFSVKQMENRRNFKERLERGDEVSLREFLYPLMQGYDSVVVGDYLEIGGFDQLFNLKAGRTIQKHYNMLEQDILTTAMLPGTDGRKMSTSWGNVINITDAPDDMFGKVMSIKDDLMMEYFLLCTGVSLGEMELIKKELSGGKNPRDIKMRLAYEIVSLYHGVKKADKARNNFVSVFQKRDIPEEVVIITAKSADVAMSLVENKIVASKSELRRLISAGAITHLEAKNKVTDIDYLNNHNGTYKIGSRRFVRIVNG
ncbi:MAG: tyrosine--tRNA ligase [Patescibacteria group bacterium]